MVYYLRTILMMGGWALHITLKASLIGGLLQNSNSGEQELGERISVHNKEGGSYIGAFYKSRWTQWEPEVMPVQDLLWASSSPDKKDLHRYLVCSFPGSNEIPNHNHLIGRASSTWTEFNSFEFQSKRDAEYIMQGDRKKQGKRLKFGWWTPTVGAYPSRLISIGFGFKFLVYPSISVQWNLWKKLEINVGDG